MYTINNKFEINEECFSVYRKPIHYKCPICEGEGHFMHNGYEIRCKNCNGTGRQHNVNQFVMDICRVRVRRIIASIWSNHMSIKYKVDVVPWSEFDVKVRVNNRSEGTLFKSLEEARDYCERVNTGRMVGEF